MQLCTDKDLAILEPSVFSESAFSHLMIVRNSSATLSGTYLLTAGEELAPVSAGMIALLGQPAQIAEFIEVQSSSIGVVSVLRSDASQAAIAPGLVGGVEFSVISFRPVIEYASRELLESIGAADRATDRQILVKQAAACRTLSLLFTALVQGVAPSAQSAMNSGEKARNDLWRQKADTYREQWESLRRQLSLRVDEDGDGNPETTLRGGVIDLWRR